eukprot:2713452-Alexandrium_andersonii.AAC.1
MLAMVGEVGGEVVGDDLCCDRVCAHPGERRARRQRAATDELDRLLHAADRGSTIQSVAAPSER